MLIMARMPPLMQDFEFSTDVKSPGRHVLVREQHVFVRALRSKRPQAHGGGGGAARPRQSRSQP